MHDHGPDPARPQVAPRGDERPLIAALCLIAIFIAIEVVVAVVARSLALLSDAAHMLTDVAALGVSLVALRLAQRPPEGGLTFGLKRAEVLGALISGATLLVLAAVLVFEAVIRLAAPLPVEGGAVIVIAAGIRGADLHLANQSGGQPKFDAARKDRSCTAGPEKTRGRDRALTRSRRQRTSRSFAKHSRAAAAPSPAPASPVSHPGLSAAGGPVR